MTSSNDNATAIEPIADNPYETAAAIVSVKQHHEDDMSTLSTNINSLEVSTTTTNIDDPQNITTTSTTTSTSEYNNDNADNILSSVKDVSLADATAITTTCLCPDPASVPIGIVRCYRIEKYDIDMNITVQLFQERFIVTCSQTNDGKISAWLLCQPIMNMYAMKRQIQWEVSHLLGGGKRDDTLLTVYCQRISTLLWERLNAVEGNQPPPPKPILFGFTLWKMSPHGGINHNLNDSIDSINIDTKNRIPTDSSTMGRHEPELFHAIVATVVDAILEALAVSVVS